MGDSWYRHCRRLDVQRTRRAFAIDYRYAKYRTIARAVDFDGNPNDPKERPRPYFGKGQNLRSTKKILYITLDFRCRIFLFPNQVAGGPQTADMNIDDLSIWRQQPDRPPAIVGCIEYKDIIFGETHKTRFAA